MPIAKRGDRCLLPFWLELLEACGAGRREGAGGGRASQAFCSQLTTMRQQFCSLNTNWILFLSFKAYLAIILASPSEATPSLTEKSDNWKLTTVPWNCVVHEFSRSRSRRRQHCRNLIRIKRNSFYRQTEAFSLKKLFSLRYVVGFELISGQVLRNQLKHKIAHRFF